PSTSVVSSLFHDTAPTEIHPLSLHDALPICGHSTFSKASAQVLSRFYGTDAILFTATSDSLPGVERSFDSLAACADEIGRSRVYGGIHFEFDNVAGKFSGRSIGEHVSDHWLLPNAALPRVTMQAHPGG